MSLPLLRRPGRSLAVLSVGARQVEWYDVDRDGRPVYGSAEADGAGPAALADAARRAQEASGGPRRPCVLALTHGMVMQRLLTLPALQRAEQRRVFARKAGKELGLPPEEALFAALRMERSDAGDGGASGERSWLLLAMNRHDLVELRTRLRGLGLNVKRVHSARLGALGLAQGLSKAGETYIAVGVEQDAVTISLARGDRLVNQDAIEGNIFDVPSLATSLISEVKSYAGYWKKTSRGGRVDHVVVLGMPLERGRLLEHAIEAALPEARVTLLPDEDESPMAGRYAFLSSVLSTGAVNLDLSARMPWKRRSLAAVAALAGIVTLTGGYGLRADLGSRLDVARAEVDELRRRSSALGEVEGEIAVTRDRVAELQGRILRAGEAGSYGIDAERVLTDALRALHGRAEFVDLTVTTSELDDAPVLTLIGRADARPATMIRALEEVVRALEDAPTLHGAEIELPDHSSDTEDESFVEFTITAGVEVRT